MFASFYTFIASWLAWKFLSILFSTSFSSIFLPGRLLLLPLTLLLGSKEAPFLHSRSHFHAWAGNFINLLFDKHPFGQRSVMVNILDELKSAKSAS